VPASLVPASLALAGMVLLPASLLAQGFGGSVAVWGNEVLVADPDFGGSEGGGIYTYVRDGDRWIETGRLTGPGSSADDGFGYGIVLSGDRMLVTALNPRSPQGGGVHSYLRTETGWSHEGMLVADGLPEGMMMANAAMSGDRAAVATASMGADGSVLLFRNTDGAWVQEAMIESPRPGERIGFGGSIALSDDLLVVGAPVADSARGTAFVYEPGPDGWTMTAELTGGDGGSFMGSAALIMDDRILVAAGHPLSDPGSVVVFARGDGDAQDGDGEDGEWTEAGRLGAFDGTPGDQFGTAMASDGATLWVGAPGADTRRGGIYEFTGDGAGGWASATKLTEPEPQSGAWMGTRVAYGNGILVSGMPRDDYGAGTALILERDGSAWTPGFSVFTEIEGMEAVLGGQVDCAEGAASAFGCSDVDLVAFVPVEDLGGNRGVRVNDVWGWTDPESQQDYAIVGRMDGTSFVDVTDPVNPVVVGNLPKPEWAPGSIWRDMKVYADHVFIVADGAADHGMQVFDLTRLRDYDGDMITFDTDAHYDRVHSVHNIVINEGTGFAYAVGASGGGDTCGGGLHMIDIREPTNPVFAGCFAHPATGRSGTGYSHDAQCVDYDGPDREHAGKEICFGSNETDVSIADVTDKDNPIPLSTATYANVAYAHQGWVTEDHRYFYLGDELDELRTQFSGTRTMIFDITDLDDPVLVKEHFGVSTASDHNMYVLDDLLYQSNYNSGLRILNVSDPENPVEVGFLDTVPHAEGPSMGGSWSNYPYFASGTIIVTSGSEGLFMVKYQKPELVP
jgi:choice-of-anchor B domain-containing protein